MSHTRHVPLQQSQGDNGGSSIWLLCRTWNPANIQWCCHPAWYTENHLVWMSALAGGVLVLGPALPGHSPTVPREKIIKVRQYSKQKCSSSYQEYPDKYFSYFTTKTSCGYSLEVPHHGKISKILLPLGWKTLSGPMQNVAYKSGWLKWLYDCMVTTKKCLFW